jgi:hypothetical protein
MNQQFNYPKIGKTYKHYKGGTYKVLTMAEHSETQEKMVVYQNVEFGGTYVRPLKMWFDEISKEDNQITLRFSLIKE